MQSLADRLAKLGEEVHVADARDGARLSDYQALREVLVKAADSVSHETNKFSIACGEAMDSSAYDSLCEALHKPCVVLASSAQVAGQCCGRTLAQQVVSQSRHAARQC